MSKIIEAPTRFPKTSSEKETFSKQLKNAFVTGVASFNTGPHSRKINVPEHQ